MRRGHGLVGLIATVAIIALLLLVVMKGSSLFGSSSGSPRADGRGTTVPGLVKAKAEDTVCRSNLQQLRMALGMKHDADGEDQWPATLEETQLGQDFYRCHLGKEPYRYSSANGEVHCPHPGHEKY